MADTTRMAGLVAERFASLDEQEGALAALRPGVPWLSACPTRGKCVIREIEPWLLRAEGGTPGGAAAAIVRRGARFSGVDLVWAGADARPEELLGGLADFARARSAPRVLLETVGAERALPRLPGEIERARSAVYCVALDASEGPEALEARLAKNHRRNVRRARKAGVARLDLDAAERVARHERLCQASFERRERRGETIASDTSSSVFGRFLASGHGRIVQVGLDGEVLSSDLVVRVADSAYYLSGGTSPEGMRIGSSHLLMLEILEELRGEGVRSLNLGYTDTDALARFKAGFGAERLEVERVLADVGNFVARQGRRAARWLRRGGRRA